MSQENVAKHTECSITPLIDITNPIPAPTVLNIHLFPKPFNLVFSSSRNFSDHWTRYLNIHLKIKHFFFTENT